LLRALPSFPTRRSSDLRGVVVVAGDPEDVGGHLELVASRGLRAERVGVVPAPPRGLAVQPAVQGIAAEQAHHDADPGHGDEVDRSEEHTSELQSLAYLV